MPYYFFEYTDEVRLPARLLNRDVTFSYSRGKAIQMTQERASSLGGVRALFSACQSKLISLAGLFDAKKQLKPGLKLPNCPL